MFRYISRLAAIAAVVPISLALSAMPSHAQVANGGSVTVTGTATCNAQTGHPTWTLHWVIDNTVTVNLIDRVPQVATGTQVNVTAADESGLATTNLQSSVSPNPIPANTSAAATDGPVPNAVGDVTLTITYVIGDAVGGTVHGAVHLDGTCVVVAPTTVAPTTVAPTTAPPAVKTAVTAAPAFTG